MKTSSKYAGLKVKTSIKAGGIGPVNHNRNGLKVKSAIRAGGIGPVNHNRKGLKVKSAIKASEVCAMRNHSGRMLAAR